jgi:hypothetical protein
MTARAFCGRKHAFVDDVCFDVVVSNLVFFVQLHVYVCEYSNLSVYLYGRIHLDMCDDVYALTVRISSLLEKHMCNHVPQRDAQL